MRIIWITRNFLESNRTDSPIRIISMEELGAFRRQSDRLRDTMNFKSESEVCADLHDKNILQVGTNTI